MNAVVEMPRTEITTPQSATALTPMAMIERALASGTTPETLEKLLALQERWEANQARKAYSEAMADTQAKMRPVSADAANPQTKSRYASYHALDGVLRPIYSEQGFALSFDTADGAPENCVRIVCIVAHRMGHSQTFHLDMPADGKGAKGGDVMTKTHATGAAVTYGRRYLLGMIFNIAVGDDTDGNAPLKPELTMEINVDQFRELKTLLEDSGSKEADMLAYVKAETLELMSLAQYAKAKAIMLHKIKIKTTKEKA